MKFIVCYEYKGANYYKIVTGGRAVQALKKRYYVYHVKRYR